MKHSKRYRSIKALMAKAVLVPLVLSTVAVVLAWEHQNQSLYGAWIVGLFSALALFAAFRLYLINLKAVLEPIEQATQTVKSLAWGHNLSALKFPHVNETSELLVAIQELGDYLMVMLAQDDELDSAATPPAARRRQEATPQPDASLDELLSNLRLTCDHLSQLSTTVVVTAPEAPASEPSEALPSASVNALKSQTERLLQVLTQFPARIGRTRANGMSQWPAGA